jgi:hypothetical protein
LLLVVAGIGLKLTRQFKEHWKYGASFLHLYSRLGSISRSSPTKVTNFNRTLSCLLLYQCEITISSSHLFCDVFFSQTPYLETFVNTTSVSKYLSPLTFFYNFDHSSYSKNFASTIYFVCYMLKYCMYFKLDLSFYMFAIIF